MDKTVVRTESAPAPFQGAPYNQAIRAGDFVFVAGQLGLKPGDKAVAGDITKQTEQALRNLAAILEAAGTRDRRGRRPPVRRSCRDRGGRPHLGS